MNTEKRQLKHVLKEAVAEVLAERPDLLAKMVESALDNMALQSAIKSGESTPWVDRAEIDLLLEQYS